MMDIALTHKYSYLLSGFFCTYKPDGSLKSLVKAFEGHAAKLAAAELKLKIKEAKKTPEYRRYFGALGEVLSEFYLKFFAGRYDLQTVMDTSDNDFCRGFDFTAASAFSDSVLALVQVKMRKDEMKTFCRDELGTLLDEANKRGILPNNLFLMVPTSELSHEDVLSYKQGFKAEYGSRIRFIGYHEMLSYIQSIDVMAVVPDTGKKETGVQTFIRCFEEAGEKFMLQRT